MLRAAACAAVLLSAAPARAADPPPLIPRELLFGNPERLEPRISPDGGRLAYIAPDQGVLNVWVRTIGKDDDRAVTSDRKRGIRIHFWAPDAERILYIQDKDGDENWHLYSVDLKTLETRDLTPSPGVQARVVALEPSIPGEILVAVNDRNPEAHDVHRLDLKTGRLTLEVRNDEGFAGFLADHALRVKKAESLQIVEALKKKNKPVEYVEYADEGHGFARPENRLDFFAKAEKFLAQHLGGRQEPLEP
jgi:dipeptidyl aminopeptidase/acylaminoacyl peptidase